LRVRRRPPPDQKPRRRASLPEHLARTTSSTGTYAFQDATLLGHTDSVQPLDISDDSDDELRPQSLRARRANAATRASLRPKSTLIIFLKRGSHLDPPRPEPLVEHAYERAQFERQPSTSYVIPREDNVTTFDLWENDAQATPNAKILSTRLSDIRIMTSLRR
ncbi:hypothetical protein A1F94_010944, partial [Pyrenophora tritici-repentis]